MPTENNSGNDGSDFDGVEDARPDDARPQEDGRVRGGKSVSAFRTISEVSAELDVPQHVLRFWETKFIQLRPLKRGGGRRYYRPEDVALLRRIHGLLYGEGYTIKGVQRVLKAPRNSAAPTVQTELLPPVAKPDPVPAPPRPEVSAAPLLREILAELKVLRALLD